MLRPPPPGGRILFEDAANDSCSALSSNGLALFGWFQ
jgi:hypothetical protein